MSQIANLRIKEITLAQQKDKILLLSDSVKFLKHSLRALAMSKTDLGASRRMVGRFWRKYDSYLELIAQHENRGKRTNAHLSELIELTRKVYESLFGVMDDELQGLWTRMLNDDTFKVEFKATAFN